jgi:hypothetical protein
MPENDCHSLISFVPDEPAHLAAQRKASHCEASTTLNLEKREAR